MAIASFKFDMEPHALDEETDDSSLPARLKNRAWAAFTVRAGSEG